MSCTKSLHKHGCKGTNNFVKACYPPLKNVKGWKIVSDEKISTMNFAFLA